VTPAKLQARFNATSGADPVFAAVDGTNCPTLPLNTLAARQSASSLLLGKGLIRVALTPPANAEFAVTSVVNPYGCSATSPVSVYRRILPTSGLSFATTVMWDGRESLGATSLNAALNHQALDAALIHQAAAAPSASTLQKIVDFEVTPYSSQTLDTTAGALNVGGALGGSQGLAQTNIAPGANDPFGPQATAPGVPPFPVFSLFNAWANLPGANPAAIQRASIARGEAIFNTRPISIRGIAGLNDRPGQNPRNTIVGTCGTCHNAPNVGSSTVNGMFNTGISNPNRASDLPLITLTNRSTAAVVQTSDPGLAMTTGLWADVGRFKVPSLRNLSARAPYFHNGTAGSLDAVVNFYNNRFNMGLTSQEHADLVAFLAAL
jgi:hypothetical protein